MVLTELIRELRKKGYSPANIADKIGVSRSTIHLWASGKVLSPRSQHVRALCESFSLKTSSDGASDTLHFFFGTPSITEKQLLQYIKDRPENDYRRGHQETPNEEALKDISEKMEILDRFNRVMLQIPLELLKIIDDNFLKKGS